MLTVRGWNLLLGDLALVAAGIGFGVNGLVLAGLTVLIWFLALWLAFNVRVRLTARRLRVSRELRDADGPVRNLWAHGSFTIRATLTSTAKVTLPYVRVVDRLPVLLRPAAGARQTDGPLAARTPLTVEYRVECEAPGLVRFDGLSVHVADVQGFFYQPLFVEDTRICRVLPALADTRARLRASKRHNILPLLGQHRHVRPGTGSELLDLRDYLPGDPPKTIAWKVSARRDRLMTKEFESEVPIRCTLFVDTSGAVRVGVPGRNALSRLVDIAAAVAQVSAATRDLTGLCLVGDDTVRIVRPARGARHLVKLRNLLADAASLPPEIVAAPVARLLPLAFSLAQERYPDEMSADINQLPWWVPWLKPQAAFTLPRPRLRARSLWTRPGVWLRRRLRYLRLWLRQAVIARVSPHYRRQYRWRKQTAALLAVHYNLGPGALALLLEDDRLCSTYLQRFLADHQVPPPVPLYDQEGRYLFAGAAKIDRLAGTLLGAVARGHDNELFVLLVDLLENDEHVGKLLAAVKVALARHHQVMVLCPWPPDLPPPRKHRPGSDGPDPRRDLLRRLPEEATRVSVLSALLWQYTTERFHRAFFTLRRSFARLGVPVLCAREEESVAIVLTRLERLRILQRGVR